MESCAVDTFFILVAVFLLAGTIKGLIGLGFPTIVLALLSLTLGLREAMALMLLPCFITNIWQAITGGNLKRIFLRIWPLLLAASISTWVTTAFITTIDDKLLSCLLGLMVCIYSVTGLMSSRLFSPGKNEPWLTPTIGLVNGVITGLTGTFVVPAVLYLQSLKLPRDVLIQAMGILFLVSTSALGSGLFSHNLFSKEFLVVSAMMILPSLAGMELGRRIRKRITERLFQKLFYLALLFLGLYIIGSCLF